MHAPLATHRSQAGVSYMTALQSQRRPQTDSSLSRTRSAHSARGMGWTKCHGHLYYIPLSGSGRPIYKSHERIEARAKPNQSLRCTSHGRLAHQNLPAFSARFASGELRSLVHTVRHPHERVRIALAHACRVLSKVTLYQLSDAMHTAVARFCPPVPMWLVWLLLTVLGFFYPRSVLIVSNLQVSPSVRIATY